MKLKNKLLLFIAFCIIFTTIDVYFYRERTLFGYVFANIGELMLLFAGIGIGYSYRIIIENKK